MAKKQINKGKTKPPKKTPQVSKTKPPKK